MKVIEKNLARKFRQKAWSLNEIVRELKVAKSSVSLWVRDIRLTKKQQRGLSLRGVRKESIEKRRISILEKTEKRHQLIRNKAKNEISELSIKHLKIIGIIFYWGEGGKSKKGIVDFSNSDPRTIQIMMRFFVEVCETPSYKFRGHINIHPHLDSERALIYWSKISGIPYNQFYKTSKQQSRASKQKRNTLPFGTFRIQICDTRLFLRIMGWIEGIYGNLIKNN